MSRWPDDEPAPTEDEVKRGLARTAAVIVVVVFSLQAVLHAARTSGALG